MHRLSLAAGRYRTTGGRAAMTWRTGGMGAAAGRPMGSGATRVGAAAKMGVPGGVADRRPAAAGMTR